MYSGLYERLAMPKGSEGKHAYRETEREKARIRNAKFLKFKNS